MGNSVVLEIILKAIDKASGVFGKIGSKLGALGGALGAVKKLASVAFGAIVGGATVAAGILKSVVDTTRSFEQRMSGVKAVLGATAEEMENLNTLALRLGRETIFTANDAAEAIEMLAKQGVSYQDIMAGAADATMDLAAATGSDMVTAANLASSAINIFGLEGSDMARVTDLMAGAVNNSAMNINDYRFALQQGSATAAQFGWDIEEVNTALALFARQGVKGERAGTGLHMLLTKLVPTTQKAADKMQDLGIITADGTNRFFDATGSMKDLAGITEVLEQAVGHLSDEEKAEALQTIFGARARRFAINLTNEGADSIRAMKEELANVSAEEIAEERLNNLNGAWEKFQGELETAKVNLGLGFMPVLTEFVRWLEEAVSKTQPLWEFLGQNMPYVLDQLKSKLLDLLGIDAGSLRETFAPLLDFLDTLRTESAEKSELEFMGVVDLDTGPAKGKLDDLMNAVRETIDNLLGEGTFDQMLSNVKEIIENLPAMLGLLADISVLAAKIAGWFSGIGEAHNNFKEAEEAALELRTELGNLITMKLNEWTSGIGDALRGLLPDLSNISIGFGDTGLAAIDLGGHLEAIGIIAGVAGEVASTHFESMRATVSERLSEMAQNVDTKWGEIKESTTTWLEKKKEEIETKYEGFLTEITEKMGEIFNISDTSWGEIFSSVREWLNQILSELRLKYDAALREVRDKMAAILGETKTKWEETFNAAKGWLEQIRDEVQDRFDEQWTKVEKVMADIKKWVEDKWEEARSAAVTKIGEIWTSVETNFNSIGTKVENIMSAVKTSVEGWLEQARLAAVQKAQDIYDAITGKVQDVLNWLGDPQRITDVKNKMADIGGAIVTKIQDQFEGRLTDLKNAIIDGVADVLEEIRKWVESWLPWKGGGGGGDVVDSGRRAGEDFVDGWVDGIQQNAATVARAVEQVSTQAQQAAQRGAFGGFRARLEVARPRMTAAFNQAMSYAGAGGGIGGGAAMLVPVPVGGGQTQIVLKPLPLKLQQQISLQMGHQEIARQVEEQSGVVAWKVDLWTPGL